MNCKYHNNIKATSTCNVCGDWICEDCVLEIESRIYCKDCLTKKLRNINIIKDDFYTKDKLSNKSSILTLILSCILPGSAHIYLGYPKKGFFILCLLIICICINAFKPLIPIICIFSLFESFKLKFDLEKGIYQEDNINNLKKFAKENKLFMFVIVLIILVPILITFFNDIFVNIKNIYFSHCNSYNIIGYFSNNIFKLIIKCLFIISIIAIIIFSIKSKNKKDNIKYDDIDKLQ